ncbi:MAG: hypothetical protein AAFX92_23125 [Pseudomonadota bacterium]
MRSMPPHPLQSRLVAPFVLVVSLILSACVSTGGKNTQPYGQSDLSTALAIASATNVGGRMGDITRPLVVAALIEEDRSNWDPDPDYRRQVLALSYRLIDVAVIAASREANSYLVDGIARRFSAREQQVILDFLNSSRGRSTFDRMFDFFEVLLESEVFGGPVNEDAFSAELTMMTRNQPSEVTRFMGLTADAAVEFASAMSRNLGTIRREIDRMAV